MIIAKVTLYVREKSLLVKHLLVWSCAYGLSDGSDGKVQ